MTVYRYERDGYVIERAVALTSEQVDAEFERLKAFWERIQAARQLPPDPTLSPQDIADLRERFGGPLGRIPPGETDRGK